MGILANVPNASAISANFKFGLPQIQDVNRHKPKVLTLNF